MTIKSILPIGALALLSACSFDNGSGQFAFDLNQLDKQQDNRTTIAGTYQTQAINSDRFEQMQINAIGNGFYQVNINTKKANNGCRFKGKAQLNNGQLRIPLSVYNKQLKATMSITFNNDKAVVDTTHPEHFNELKKFCRSGSLVGGYYRIPN